MLKIHDLFDKIRNKPEEDMDDYEEKLKKHRKKRIASVVVPIMVLVLAGFVYYMYITNRTYDSYEIKDTIPINIGSNANYYVYADGFLLYSDDGIKYVRDEDTIWNQAFEMKNPVIAICENTVAVADKKTNVVYVFNSEGLIGQVKTTYPILSLSVSKQGIVAAITEDQNTNLIEMYDKKGKAIAKGESYITGEGCPVDLSLSMDGTKLMVSYVIVDGEKVNSRVVFYNYSEVGKNEVGRVVGGFNQPDDVLVSRVVFLENNTAACFGTDGITIYEIKEKPVQRKKIKISEQILSVFYNPENVGVVCSSEKGAKPYLIKTYDLDGNKELEKSTDFAYSEIMFSEDGVVLYNYAQMQMWNLSGKIRFAGTIDEGIQKIIPTSKDYKYYIVGNDYNIYMINLK